MEQRTLWITSHLHCGPNAPALHKCIALLNSVGLFADTLRGFYGGCIQLFSLERRCGRLYSGSGPFPGFYTYLSSLWGQRKLKCIALLRPSFFLWAVKGFFRGLKCEITVSRPKALRLFPYYLARVHREFANWRNSFPWKSHLRKALTVS